MRLEEVKELNELEVYCDKRLAGHLRRTKVGSEFEFEKNFFSEQGRGISFHLNKSKSLYKFQGDSLPAFFAGLLPEGLRLKALTQKVKTSEDDLFSLLAAIGSQCVGNVYVRYKSQNQKTPKLDDEKNKSFVGFKDVDFYRMFEESMQTEDFYLYDEALAGVQEKISASMISFPVDAYKKNQFFILKLNPKDKPLLVKNECLSLNLAKKCGLEVNNASLIEDKNKQQGLLVERFDRFYEPNKKETVMFHQEDGCQFLNRYSADKYRLSFKEVLSGIQTYATAPKIEILKAIQLYAFSYLIGNGDLHAKNISLQILKPSGKVVLTPCYDIISTYIYKDHKMALKLNGRDENIKRKDFVELGVFFSIPEKSIIAMLEKLLNLFEKNYEIVFDFMNEKQKYQWLKMYKSRKEHLA